MESVDSVQADIVRAMILHSMQHECHIVIESCRTGGSLGGRSCVARVHENVCCAKGHVEMRQEEFARSYGDSSLQAVIELRKKVFQMLRHIWSARLRECHAVVHKQNAQIEQLNAYMDAVKLPDDVPA